MLALWEILTIPLSHCFYRCNVGGFEGTTLFSVVIWTPLQNGVTSVDFWMFSLVTISKNTKEEKNVLFHWRLNC